jgi:hypothetical protein
MELCSCVCSCIPHSTQGIFDLDIAELLVSKCLDLLQELALCGQNLLEGLFEIQLRRRGVIACLYYTNKALMPLSEVQGGQLHTRDKRTRR